MVGAQSTHVWRALESEVGDRSAAHSAAPRARSEGAFVAEREALPISKLIVRPAGPAAVPIRRVPAAYLSIPLPERRDATTTGELGRAVRGDSPGRLPAGVLRRGVGANGPLDLGAIIKLARQRQAVGRRVDDGAAFWCVLLKREDRGVGA